MKTFRKLMSSACLILRCLVRERARFNPELSANSAPGCNSGEAGCNFILLGRPAMRKAGSKSLRADRIFRELPPIGRHSLTAALDNEESDDLPFPANFPRAVEMANHLVASRHPRCMCGGPCL